MNEMGNVIHRFDIKAGEVLTVEQMKAMTLALKAGQLKVEHLKQIAGITKSFNMVALEAARSFTASVESAGKVKESALENLRAIVKSLEVIATSTDDIDTKNKIIECLMQVADKVEAADKRNDKFFIAVAMLAASAVATVIARRPVRIA